MSKEFLNNFESIQEVESSQEEKEKDLAWIESVLPHREGALLLSRVLELEQGKRCVAEYDIPEDFHGCRGHFPKRQIVPGHYLAEMGNLASAVILLTMPEYKGKTAYAGKMSYEPKGIARPGDKLKIESELVKSEPAGKRKKWTGAYKIFRGNKLIGAGTIESTL